MPDFDTGYNLFKIIAFIFPVIFIFVFASIFFAVIKGLKQWSYNNKQPQLTVSTKVVTKRTNISHHRDSNQVGHTSTSYYITFEVESGDRMELQVSGMIYGQIVENDIGRLTFQGTRFINFER